MKIQKVSLAFLLSFSFLGLSKTAQAQLPFPIPGQAEKRSPQKQKPIKVEEEKNLPPKDYKKPEPKALPEGEVTDLSGPIVLVDFRAIVNALVIVGYFLFASKIPTVHSLNRLTSMKPENIGDSRLIGSVRK